MISAERLSALLGAPGVLIVDSSWYLPSAQRDPEAEYGRAHIPGAIRLPLDAISDPDSPLPHTLPTPDQFAARCEAYGIGRRHQIVVYDTSTTRMGSARAWWTFRVFGHTAVTVLDGGFHAWAGATRPIQTGVQRRPRTGYPVPEIDARLVVDLAEIERITAGEVEAQLIDCRSEARFRGEVDEPRPGLRRGHIAGSANIPYDEFTDPVSGRIWPADKLAAIFADRGIDLHRRIVASCGSGTSACVLGLAVEAIRASDPGAVGPPVAIYDGSWAEYGRIN